MPANPLLDRQFWLVIAWCVPVISLGLLWIRTGRSPLFWTAWVLLHAEAARRQAGQTILAATQHFLDGYPQQARTVFMEMQRSQRS